VCRRKKLSGPGVESKLVDGGIGKCRVYSLPLLTIVETLENADVGCGIQVTIVLVDLDAIERHVRQRERWSGTVDRMEGCPPVRGLKDVHALDRNGGAGATGGGFSSVFARPEYQDGIPGIGAFRGVPDVAFVADPLTGVPVVVSAFGETLIIPVGGTSVGSPAWAGIVALADQAAGERLGFLNDGIYRLLASDSYSQGFHDITTGDNSTTIPGSNGQPVPVPGYPAGPGWDAVTGAGTPKVSSLVSLLDTFAEGS